MSNHVPNHPETQPSTQPSGPPTLVLVPSGSTRSKRGRVNPAGKYRGVQIIAPTPDHGHRSWRLRWTDPDSRRARFRNLTEAEAKTADTRRDAAVTQREDLDQRRRELKRGATPFKNGDVKIVDAFKKYDASWALQKRSATREAYRRGCDLFEAWCARAENRHTLTRDITRGMLREYAGSRAAVVHTSGPKRGLTRAPATVNKELKWLRAVLCELHRLELIGITLDDVTAGLKTLRESIGPGDVFRESSEILAMLGACVQYDVTTRRGADSVFAGRMLSVTLFMLLTGLRPKEALGLEWTNVSVVNGHPRITVPTHVAKTRRERVIDTAHSPLLGWLISNHAKRKGPILGDGSSYESLSDARTRIGVDHGIAFTFKKLRRTCGTYLTCAPSIFGAASVYMSAKQLGHTVGTAQKNYLGVVTVSPDARTTEAAMGIVTDRDADADVWRVSVTGAVGTGDVTAMVRCRRL